MDIKQTIKNYITYNEDEDVEKEVFLEFLNNYDNYLSRDNKIGHITTSAVVLNKEHTKMLMCYHNIYDSWAWLGGHADGESDLIKKVKEEVQEETGITAKLLNDNPLSINIICVHPHYKNDKYVNSHLHFDISYLLEADENDTIKSKDDENKAVAWVPLEQVILASTEEHMHPVYNKILNKINDKTAYI